MQYIRKENLQVRNEVFEKKTKYNKKEQNQQ